MASELAAHFGEPCDQFGIAVGQPVSVELDVVLEPGAQMAAELQRPAALTPTPLATAVFDDSAHRAAALARIPMGRFGTPDDLIEAAVYFLSPAAAFVTGQVLFVDGGRTIS